jgi:hypothetical protein
VPQEKVLLDPLLTIDGLECWINRPYRLIKPEKSTDTLQVGSRSRESFAARRDIQRVACPGRW